jgi:hypothetical protein
MQKVNGWQTPSDGKSSHCLWQGELKRRLTILFSTGRIIFANLPKLGKLNALFFMSAYTSVDCFFWKGIHEGSGFPTSYIIVFFFMFSELKWEVIVHFVDIVGVVTHHYLNFLFIIIRVRAMVFNTTFNNIS